MFAIQDKSLWLQVFLVNVGEKPLGLTPPPPQSFIRYKIKVSLRTYTRLVNNWVRWFIKWLTVTLLFP